MSQEYGKISRFQKHLHILGIEDTTLEPEQINREKQLIEQMNPNPLDLSKAHEETWLSQIKIKLFSKPTWTLLTAACGIFFMVYLIDKEENIGIRSKGKSRVKVYYEFNQVVKTYNPNVSLPMGAKVQVEIMAAENLVAYLNVVDKNAKPLLSKEYILEQAIKIKVGDKSSFADSLELTGPSEGETLDVMICKADKIADLKSWNPTLDSFFTQRESNHKACEVYTFKLR